MAKIERAEEQRVALEGEIRAFETDLAAQIEREKRPDTDQQAWVFRGEMPSVPISWSIRIGEFLYNLRSGLDHLVWQLVVANGQTPGTRNQFPIYRDENKYDRESRSRLRGVGDGAAVIIRELQPFVGRRDDLWRLQSLGNFDKHRHLNLGTVVVDDSELSLDARPQVEVRFEQPIPNVHLLSVAKNLSVCLDGVRAAVDSLIPEVENSETGISED
jgi:hypothetical protein